MTAQEISTIQAMIDSAGSERSMPSWFEHCVAAEFAFLGQHGFERITSTARLVEYRRGDVVAQVLFQPALSMVSTSMPLELSFAIRTAGEMYPLWAIIQSDAKAAKEVEASRFLKFSVPRSNDQIAKGVAHIAGYVGTYALGALTGSPDILAGVESSSEKRLAQFAVGTRYNSTKAKAFSAFKAGRYGEAAMLLEDVKAVLSPAELKRLAIAKARAQSS